jgi:threonine dehydratase
VEPTGALALAAWLRGAAAREAQGHVVIVISGGNVEMGAYRGWLAEAEALSSDAHA